MRLILTGATGLVGSAALNHILSLPPGEVSHLYILSRKPVPAAENRPDVTVIEHKNFNEYTPELLERLKGADGCIWALGISQTQVSKEEYVKITVDYPLAAAKAFSGLSDSFNFVYISGEGATQEPGRFTPYFGRIKGECESALIALSKKYPSLKPYSVRPAIVDATFDPPTLANVMQRPDHTVLKRVLLATLGPVTRQLYSKGISPTKDLGRFMTDLAKGNGQPLTGDGISGDGWIISNVAFRRAAGI
ncbi:hypothetical protein BDV32DRAFT_151206 [Aspergillus pseudonomiae]|uniref:Uncharacterized protein n=1 Tax=Aspergillus pseudonomiae TaxID=1506151 RepID=A0A5N6HYT6_9EURO|nr:uncharacterized protein BDV37DRAFT_284675 [Aspergillus pseudonomiae]KAB8258580.1 hypothetical protein BDV32DRAFT_151206 [Aspergillus pseudonomiae]KAE8402538.1 hypothetical protein BDV37DRAFT_284675 [Aspergillus pseudonomiae]